MWKIIKGDEDWLQHEEGLKGAVEKASNTWTEHKPLISIPTTQTFSRNRLVSLRLLAPHTRAPSAWRALSAPGSHLLTDSVLTQTPSVAPAPTPVSLLNSIELTNARTSPAVWDLETSCELSFSNYYIKEGLTDTVGEGERGTNGESSVDTHSYHV